MNLQNTDSNNWCEDQKKNTVRLGLWTLAWTLSMALAAFGPKFIWDSSSFLTIASILVNLGLGIGMIIANKNHLQGLDELQQKIQLEAMALSLGVGIVCGLSYSLLDVNNTIPFDAEISFLVILMSLTYMAGIIYGKVRYQ